MKNIIDHIITCQQREGAILKLHHHALQTLESHGDIEKVENNLF